jgi:hypothetical protein
MKAKHSLIRKILITSTVPSVVFPFINYVTENKETKKISNKISAPAIISLSDVILPSYTNLGSFESLPTADTILATLNSQSDS